MDALIEQSEARARHYLFEEYLDDRRRRPSRALRYYYAAQGRDTGRPAPSPQFPRRSQPAAAEPFPTGRARTPCCTYGAASWRRCSMNPVRRTPGISGFWPDDYRACIVLTHDVESARGLARMERMADLEERYGFRSAWNLALDQYPIDWQPYRMPARPRFRIWRARPQARRTPVPQRSGLYGLAPRLKRIAGEHEFAGISRALHPAARGMDSAPGVRL